MDRPSSGRFLLWIDGVGGFLVCERTDVVLGQAVGDAATDVPIVGDVSRQHARIRRDGESYVIEPLRGAVRLDERPVGESALLGDECSLVLGGGVKLRFRRTHPLSATARLDFLSDHNLVPAVDGVLLLADSCVLGPAANAHVRCPDWKSSVVLFRREGRLHCQTTGTVDVDGRRRAGGGALSANSRVSGADFALALEPLA
jgi:hypothetical protein